MIILIWRKIKNEVELYMLLIALKIINTQLSFYAISHTQLLKTLHVKTS